MRMVGDHCRCVSLCTAESLCRALGTPTSGREIHMDYAMAAVEALQSTLEQGQPFRFVLVSGSLVEADQTKTLWLLSGMRKMRVCLSTLFSFAVARLTNCREK